MNLSVRVLLLLMLFSFLQKKSQALQTSVTPSLSNEDDEGGDIVQSKKKAFVVARVYPSEYLHLQKKKDEPDDSLLMEKNDGPAAILDILNQIDNDADGGGDSRSKDQNQIHLKTTLVTRSTKDKTDTTSSTLNTATTTMTNTSTAQKEDKLIPTTPSKITERRNSPDDNGKNNNASNERKIKCNCNEKGISYQNCYSMVIQLSCVES